MKKIQFKTFLRRLNSNEEVSFSKVTRIEHKPIETYVYICRGDYKPFLFPKKHQGVYYILIIEQSDIRYYVEDGLVNEIRRVFRSIKKLLSFIESSNIIKLSDIISDPKNARFYLKQGDLSLNRTLYPQRGGKS